MKRGKAVEQDMAEAVKWMCTLNTFGEIVAKHQYIHALTDITGFGLLGHVLEMAEGSNLSAKIYMEKVPLLNNIGAYLDQFIFPDMTTRNFNSYKDKMNDLSARQLLIGCDPQTSGGLLLAVDPLFEKEFINLCKDHGMEHLVKESVGVLTEKKEKSVFVY